jgi:hypothetical protein
LSGNDGIVSIFVAVLNIEFVKKIIEIERWTPSLVALGRRGVQLRIVGIGYWMAMR